VVTGKRKHPTQFNPEGKGNDQVVEGKQGATLWMCYLVRKRGRKKGWKRKSETVPLTVESTFGKKNLWGKKGTTRLGRERRKGVATKWVGNVIHESPGGR